MTVRMDVDNITWVQIAGEWTRVQPGSFSIESMAFVESGREDALANMGRWFGFATPKGEQIAAPLTSIQALKYATPDEEK